MNFEYASSEVNPAIINIVSPSGVVVVSTSHIELGGGGGDLHITMPYLIIEPIHGMLDTGFQPDHDGQDERWIKALCEDMLDVQAPLGAAVVRRQLKLRDILHMQPGNVILVEMPEHIVMRAGGMPTFKVKLGVHKGNLVLQILEAVERSRRPPPPGERRIMTGEEKVTTGEQTPTDEWAATLIQAGDASQDDIDALMTQGGVTPATESSTPRAPMEEFGALPKAPTIPGLKGPNLDMILDILVTIPTEVGYTDIGIHNLLQLNQGSVIELDCLAGESLDVLINGTLITHGEMVVVNKKFGICLTDAISPGKRTKRLC